MKALKKKFKNDFSRNPVKFTLFAAFSCVVAIGLVISTEQVWADFSNSPTNYVPAVSDIYVCNVEEGTVSLLNGISGHVIKTINLPPGAKPFGVALSPNYRQVYVTDNSLGNIYLLRNTRLVAVIDTPAASAGPIAIHPRGRFAYISYDGGLMVLDIRSRTITDSLAIDFAGSIVFTPDGSRAYISIDGNFGSFSQVKVIDTATHTVVDTIQLPVPTAPLGLAASNDSTRIYVCGWLTNDVTVLDIDPASPSYHTVIETIPVDGRARGIALTPSGNLAYVTLDTGGVDVVITNPLNSQFHQVIAHISEAGPFGGIHGIATSLDGRFQYVSVGASGHNQLYVVDSDYFSSTFNTVINMFTVGQVPLGIGARPHR